MKKCKMTMTGKHIFGLYLGGYKDTSDEKVTCLIPKYQKMCKACGVIDDRKKV